MLKYTITYFFIFSLISAVAQQDSAKLTLGFNVGYMGAKIYQKAKYYEPDYAYGVDLSQNVINPNFNFRLRYGKNNMDIGFTTGKRMVFSDYAHSFAGYGLTALLLNYQRRLFQSKTISIYGSYIFLSRFLNNYKTNAGDGLGEFTVNYFSIEQFIGYAVKLRLYREFYLEQKGGYGYGFGSHTWNYKKHLHPPYQNPGEKTFSGQALLLSIGIGYDFQCGKK